MNTEDWTGYNPILGNGSRESLANIERHYEQGVIGDRHTSGLYIEEVLERSDVPIVDEDLEPLEDPPKVIYAHPSKLDYPSGTRLPVEYRGSRGNGAADRLVDSAVLIVDVKPPVSEVVEVDSINSILAGDSEDELLEDEIVSIQTYPFMV